MGRQFDDDEVKRDMKWLPFDVVNKDSKPYVSVAMPGETKKTQISPEEVSAMILVKMK
jgi:endoplasmic reticulum chaperone BiP